MLRPHVASQRGQVRMWVSVGVATCFGTGAYGAWRASASFRAVNLFVIGFSREGALAREDAADALERLLDRLPFFKTGDVRAWCSPSGTAAAATATHSLEQTGGVEYVRVRSDGFVLFAGRPIAWTGEATADGR